MMIIKTLRQLKPTLNSVRFANRAAAAATEAKPYDPSQAAQLDDKCILVDRDDQATGWATKKDCHLLSNINKGMLHRAFSVFLFDSNKRLLLQQRSLKKITYPNHWTNTCCSHPLFVGEEMDETNDHIGIKRAAKRRYKHPFYKPNKLNTLNLIFQACIRAGNRPESSSRAHIRRNHAHSLPSRQRAT